MRLPLLSRRTVSFSAGQFGVVLLIAVTLLGSDSIATLADEQRQGSLAPGSKTEVLTPADLSISGWGELVHEDNFDELKTEGANDWYVYNYPHGTPVRKADNARTAIDGDGTAELQLDGVYDRKTGEHSGSGISSKFDQKYGVWEVRFRADRGAGFSPTILLWPTAPAKWPADGEIDIFESPLEVHQGGIFVLHNGSDNKTKSKGVEADFTQWHTVTVDWEPDRITFYLDGEAEWTSTDMSYNPTTSPMHLVLQMDAGCGWIQCPNRSTPQTTTMHVDSIKVYKTENTVAA